MSVDICNRITLTGNKDQIKLFKQENRPPKPEKNKHGDEPYWEPFAFECIHDCGPALYDRKQVIGEDPHWVTWRLANWGTLHNPTCIEDWKDGRNKNSILFETGNTPCASWVSNIAKYYEKLTIKFYSSDVEDGWVHYDVYNKGVWDDKESYILGYEEDYDKDFWKVAKQSQGIASRTALKKYFIDGWDEEGEEKYNDWCRAYA